MRCSGSTCAVSRQMGMLDIDFRSRASSRPLSPGIITSRMTTSNARPRIAAIALAGLLHDPPLIHELLENAGQALLRNLQNLQQVGDAKAGMAIDEMQHAVMRASETELGQRRIRLPGEVAVGEEQQLDEGDELRI